MCFSGVFHSFPPKKYKSCYVQICVLISVKFICTHKEILRHRHSTPTNTNIQPNQSSIPTESRRGGEGGWEGLGPGTR